MARAIDKEEEKMNLQKAVIINIPKSTTSITQNAKSRSKRDRTLFISSKICATDEDAPKNAKSQRKLDKTLFVKDKVCVVNEDDDNFSLLDGNPWDKLDDVMVETLLSWLPTMDIVRCMLVCKRWSSIIHSPTFSISSHQLFDRRQWFLAFTGQQDCVVYDMEVYAWRFIHFPLPIDSFAIYPSPPMASSAGLLCFLMNYDTLVVCNPLTGLLHTLPRLLEEHIFFARAYKKVGEDYTKGFAIHASSGTNYNVFVAIGRGLEVVSIKLFSSSNQEKGWIELPLRELTDGEVPWKPVRKVCNNMEWASFTGFKGVTTVGKEGQILVHYVTQKDGNLVCCDTQKGTIVVCPSLPLQEGTRSVGIDLVECDGRVFVVGLLEEGKLVRLRIWEFNYEIGEWKHIAIMPLEMSQEEWKNVAIMRPEIHLLYYLRRPNMNCGGSGNYIMINGNSYCKNPNYRNRQVVYNIKDNTWFEPPVCPNRRPTWVFSIKPDVASKV